MVQVQKELKVQTGQQQQNTERSWDLGICMILFRSFWDPPLPIHSALHSFSSDPDQKAQLDSQSQ
jgi:hypothetical protein